MAKVINPKTGEATEIEDDFDLKTGENRALVEAQKKGYKPGYDVVNPKTGQSHVVDDLKGAQAKGYVEGSEFAGRKDAVDKYKDGITKTESASRGWFDGVSQGLGDEIVGGVKAAGSKIATLGGSDFTDDYAKERDAIRENNRMAEEVNPGSYGLSKFGGNVVSSIAAGGALKAVPAVANATAAGKAALGAGKIATGAELAAAGALQSGVSSFGEAEGDISHQLSETAKGAAIGAGLGVALPVAANLAKKVVSAPFKYAAGMKDRLLKKSPDAAEFLGKQAKNVDEVMKQPIESNVAEQSVKLLKEDFPDIHRGFSKDLKEVKGEAKKNIDKLYGKFAEAADNAKTPVDFDTPTSTDDLLNYIDDALENPLSEKFGLNPVVQKELQAARDQITKGVQLNSKATEVVDPITKEVKTVAVPFTEGEVLKKGVQIIRAIKDRAFTRDDKGNYLKDLQGLRDMSGNLDEILYANTKGTYPQDALDALRNANKIYRDYKQAGEALEPVMAYVGGKYRPDANKFENALNKYEGQGDLDNAFNKYREIAGQTPKDNFAPNTQLKEGIADVLNDKAARESQKIRFDNLDDGGFVTKAISAVPVVGKYVPTSAQNKIRMLNAIDSGVAKGKAGLDAFAKKEYMQGIAEKAPILASWLKQVAEDSSRPITRAVVQSIARHAKVPEDEVESHLRELGLSIKP